MNSFSSSNINEIIRAVLNSLFFLFLRKDFAHTKSTKSTKSTKTQPNKNTNRYKRAKIKNVLKKHRRGEKSLICLFSFSCFLRTRRKENRKKKIEKREKSLQGNVLKEDKKREKSNVKGNVNVLNTDTSLQSNVLNTETSLQGNVRSPQLGWFKYSYTYMNRVVGTSILKIS